VCVYMCSNGARCDGYTQRSTEFHFECDPMAGLFFLPLCDTMACLSVCLSLSLALSLALALSLSPSLFSLSIFSLLSLSLSLSLPFCTCTSQLHSNRMGEASNRSVYTTGLSIQQVCLYMHCAYRPIAFKCNVNTDLLHLNVM
jgi:hypothetical protein